MKMSSLYSGIIGNLTVRQAPITSRFPVIRLTQHARLAPTQTALPRAAGGERMRQRLIGEAVSAVGANSAPQDQAASGMPDPLGEMDTTRYFTERWTYDRDRIDKIY
ncbi:hypothetical protein ES703_78226 [subsurface metagenome]